MPRTPVRRVGQESVSLQALVPWCSSCNGLMGGMVMRPREANYYRYYKRLGAFAKLATSYMVSGEGGKGRSSTSSRLGIVQLPLTQGCVARIVAACAAGEV